ncbi:hypothetical protein GCK72_015884 [Caenorhabditis remanei]|uniref:Uncharacterized protein n=1 Tax=Caenorhabditis remanei TaxID=31234 RepID=A0A6A5GW83_CAERE|nr:hypothetical protein GCK72_015884 [Caenorhabditis remanei]KAF1759417.1 hypothetical protein GCK72_015884 [Caenorhabditis remanei]
MDPSKILGFLQNPLVQLQDECARHNATKLRNVELTEDLENKMAKIYELFAQRDDLMEDIGATQTAKMGLEKQNAELIGKLEKMNIAMQELITERDSYKMEIQAFKEVAERNWKEDYLKRILELQGQHDIALCDKDRMIHNQGEQHAKQIEDMDLELKTLKTQQEQHAKELNDKDLAIKELEARLSAAEQNRKEVVTEPTQLHTELGKLYLELQEAKKPQEALMARLAAKNKGIEYLTKQYEAKLAAKDSEIERLTEIVKDGEEKKKIRMEMVANLRKTIFAKESEIMKKFNAMRQEAPQSPKLLKPEPSIEYEDIGPRRSNRKFRSELHHHLVHLPLIIPHDGPIFPPDLLLNRQQEIVTEQ